MFHDSWLIRRREVVVVYIVIVLQLMDHQNLSIWIIAVSIEPVPGG